MLHVPFQVNKTGPSSIELSIVDMDAIVPGIATDRFELSTSADLAVPIAIHALMKNGVIPTNSRCTVAVVDDENWISEESDYLGAALSNWLQLLGALAETMPLVDGDVRCQTMGLSMGSVGRAIERVHAGLGCPSVAYSHFLLVSGQISPSWRGLQKGNQPLVFPGLRTDAFGSLLSTLSQCDKGLDRWALIADVTQIFVSCSQSSLVEEMCSAFEQLSFDW